MSGCSLPVGDPGVVGTCRGAHLEQLPHEDGVNRTLHPEGTAQRPSTLSEVEARGRGVQMSPAAGC